MNNKLSDESLDLTLLDNFLDLFSESLNDHPSQAKVQNKVNQKAIEFKIEPSSHIKEQLTLEFSSDIISQLLSIHDMVNWDLIVNNLIEFPVFCIYCHSQYCVHITTYYGGKIQFPDDNIAFLWNDKILAQYHHEKIQMELEAGFFN